MAMAIHRVLNGSTKWQSLDKTYVLENLSPALQKHILRLDNLVAQRDDVFYNSLKNAPKKPTPDSTAKLVKFANRTIAIDKRLMQIFEQHDIKFRDKNLEKRLADFDNANKTLLKKLSDIGKSDPS